MLDLGHPGSYRDLSKPIAVQIPERAKAVAAHYADAEKAARNLLNELSDPNDRPLPSRTRTDSQTLPITPKLVGVVCPPYHYPSHCSNEAIVLSFLVRLLPYAFRHLRFQGWLLSLDFAISLSYALYSQWINDTWRRRYFLSYFSLRF